MTTLPIANIVQPLIDVFDHVLVFFHDKVGLGWGMSIIALTVCVRAVLIPLTLKQFRSMQSLQRLAPEIKQLQEKYKDDKQRLNQEMMKFYQENKVNPFGSCLPLVAQLPVFLSLFYMLRKDLKHDICPGITEYAAQHGKSIASVSCDQVDPGSAQFLFIHDLTARATGVVLVVLLVLYVGSQLLSSVLMSVTADRNQRFIMIALPFVFVPFIQGFPAGLIVYWITTNFWTVGQQYVIRRTAGLPVRGAPVPTGASAAVSSRSDRQKDKAEQKEKAAPKERAAPKDRAQPKDQQQPRQAKGAATDGDGDGTPERRASAPPRPPRQRRKKKTGRRR
jgi:YidC/Oxa1 family membrane protein insertase